MNKTSLCKHGTFWMHSLFKICTKDLLGVHSDPLVLTTLQLTFNYERDLLDHLSVIVYFFTHVLISKVFEFN